MIYISLYLCSFITGQLTIRFSPETIIPENGKLSSLNCSIFRADDAIGRIQYSKFRVRVPEADIDLVNVTVLGENMTCGHDLYAMTLKSEQTATWKGIWLTCPLLEMSDDRRRRCTFGCKCNGVCKEIQISRRPRSFAESTWTLCYVSLNYETKGMCALHF